MRQEEGEEWGEPEKETLSSLVANLYSVYSGYEIYFATQQWDVPLLDELTSEGNKEMHELLNTFTFLCLVYFMYTKCLMSVSAYVKPAFKILKENVAGEAFLFAHLSKERDECIKNNSLYDWAAFSDVLSASDRLSFQP